jgi:hypothetical protein
MSDLSPYLRRAFSLLLSFGFIALSVLFVVRYVPELRLIAAMIVGVTSLWVIANYIVLMMMLVRNETTA